MNNNSSKYIYLNELIDRQLKNISPSKRLLTRDFNRIIKYINSSIFDKEKCCIWTGYIANLNSNSGKHISYCFQKKKMTLHRLLYENYVEPIGDDCYIRYTCNDVNNRGMCCNIHHMVKQQCVPIKSNENSENEKDDKNECDGKIYFD